VPGEPVRLGPFEGGMNTLSDPTSLSDTELVDCVNFELDLDGSLVSRPPITLYDAVSFGTGRVMHLGFAMIGGTVYHIASTTSETAWSTDGSNWTTITNLFGASAAVQYANKVWLINPTGAGGQWTPSGGFVSVAAMPAGTAAVTLKERLYIVGNPTNTSRLFFSAITDPTVWNAADFIDVNVGDGQRLIDINIFNDNIMLFKEDSTYTFPFDAGPSTGTLRKISSTIGATRRDCVALYEQNLYIYHEGNVYEVINYDFSRLNSKVPFEYDSTAPSAFTDEAFICIIGDRLLVRYYNRIYVYGLRTRTWTRWTSQQYFGPFRAAPVNTTAAVNPSHYAGACVVDTNGIFRFDDGFDAVRSETMTVSIETKNYDLSISHKFKRLFWWGADIAASGDVTGTVTPVVYTFQSMWSSLSSLTWSQLTTWERPTTSPNSITTIASAAIGGGARKFVKFLKSIRFRQVNFKMSTETTGTSVDAPVRLFTITALVNQKQDVSQQVS
jgi:hypothetical protein